MLKADGIDDPMRMDMVFVLVGGKAYFITAKHGAAGDKLVGNLIRFFYRYIFLLWKALYKMLILPAAHFPPRPFRRFHIVNRCRRITVVPTDQTPLSFFMLHDVVDRFGDTGL